jgi:hypothetical protein
VIREKLQAAGRREQASGAHRALRLRIADCGMMGRGGVSGMWNEGRAWPAIPCTVVRHPLGRMTSTMWYYHPVPSSTRARLYHNLAQVSEWSAAWCLRFFPSYPLPLRLVPSAPQRLRVQHSDCHLSPRSLALLAPRPSHVHGYGRHFGLTASIRPTAGHRDFGLRNAECGLKRQGAGSRDQGTGGGFWICDLRFTICD